MVTNTGSGSVCDLPQPISTLACDPHLKCMASKRKIGKISFMQRQTLLFNLYNM